MKTWNRRNFLQSAGWAAASFGLLPACTGKSASRPEDTGKRFKISLAQWSLHRALQSGQLDHLLFADKAASLGIYAVEYVNSFFKDKATDKEYLEEMNTRAKDLNVRQLLIMVDGEGGLAEPDAQQRSIAVANHHKWIDTAKALDCHSIRVNLYGSSTDRKAMQGASVDSLSRLAEYARPMDINILVENHGGLSSDGAWLAGVIKEVSRLNCGTLPDFGNFCLSKKTNDLGEDYCVEEYDRYKGVKELMPYAKAVSAKTYDFDPMGNDTLIDFSRMMGIVKASTYSGFIGIEYEGTRLSEEHGITATRRLLERLI